MKLTMLAAAVAAGLGCVCFNAGAANLGLDATCASNGTDRGMVATPEGSRRRCDLPPDIVTTNPSDPIVALPAAVAGTPILWAIPTIVKVGNGHLAGQTPSTAAITVLQIVAGARLAGAIANSALVITRGARLNALGTPTNPIVFSSLDNNYTGTAEWGGLILSSWDSRWCGGECEMEGISDGRLYDLSGAIPGAFSNIEYACSDNLNLLPASSPASGFANGTFWSGYPGTCN